MPGKIELSSEKILTIIIGVKELENEPLLPKLNAAENNANAFYTMVKNRKFKPKKTAATGENADPSDLDEASTTLPDRAVSFDPDKNILRLIDKHKHSEIMERITDFILAHQQGIELIQFYYSGHAAWDSKVREYYLSAFNTQKSTLAATSLSLKTIYSTLASLNKPIAFIIDACFSSNSFKAISDGYSEDADIYLMTSCKGTEPSIYPPGEQYSLFTNEMISTIENGIPGVSGALTYKEIFNDVKEKMAVKGIQEPKDFDAGQVSAHVFEENLTSLKGTDLMDELRNTIYTSLFDSPTPNAFNSQDMDKTLFSNYPSIISIYISNIFAYHKNGGSNIDIKELLVDLYTIILKLLGFIFIKDLKDKKKLNYLNYPVPKDSPLTLSPEDEQEKILFNLWNNSPTTNSYYIKIIKIACSKYQPQLYIKELRTNTDFIGKIDKIETMLADSKMFNLVDFQRTLFELIAKLSFLQKYKLFAIRYVQGSKTFFGNKFFVHELSSLYGLHPDPYDNKYQGKHFMSENEFFNTAVIFFHNVLPENLTELIRDTDFLNLWPFIIDGAITPLITNEQDKDEQNKNKPANNRPKLYVFESAQDLNGSKRYNYRDIELINERKLTKEYSSLNTFPWKKEVDQYAVN